MKTTLFAFSIGNLHIYLQTKNKWIPQSRINLWSLDRFLRLGSLCQDFAIRELIIFELEFLLFGLFLKKKWRWICLSPVVDSWASIMSGWLRVLESTHFKNSWRELIVTLKSCFNLLSLVFRYAPDLYLKKVSGASAGAIAAACILCDAPLGMRYKIFNMWWCRGTSYEHCISSREC